MGRRGGRGLRSRLWLLSDIGVRVRENQFYAETQGAGEEAAPCPSRAAEGHTVGCQADRLDYERMIAASLERECRRRSLAQGRNRASCLAAVLADISSREITRED